MTKQFYKACNVNDAFAQLVKAFNAGELDTITTSSRNGPVLQAVHPVTICYENPRQRVLMNKARDANPFFHLFESLYMLSGGQLIKPLAHYVSNMKNYSDDGVTQNGAYGHRWLNLHTNQVSIIINHLQDQPNSRRAVLQMWDVSRDLKKIDDQFKDIMYYHPGWTPKKYGTSKDVCCNLSCVFMQRDVNGTQYLDMTVFNRSNDLIWGALGANVVHFSFLQEYIANCLGVQVGRYHQVSSNMHVYVDNWKPEEWLSNKVQLGYGPVLQQCRHPLLTDRARFDAELDMFVDAYSYLNREDIKFEEPFLQKVAKPMCLAFNAHKDRDYKAAYGHLAEVDSDDWRVAGYYWIGKREQNWRKKNA